MLYLVTENGPGYLPESEPAEFESHGDAVDHAVMLSHELQSLGYHVHRHHDQWFAESRSGARVVEIRQGVAA